MTMATGTAVSFREELLRSGLLAVAGVPGVYRRSAEFEDTVERIDRRISRAVAGDGAEVVRFPPIMDRDAFARSGYLRSFPHLAGIVHAFAGDERAHLQLLADAEQGSAWSTAFEHAGVVLTPAACYPVYPTLAGTLPAGGRLIDVMSYCFRHEPSDDPARMQAFRMHEQVRAGDREGVLAWRDAWIPRVDALMTALGLQATVDVAADPFFGRGGKLLASDQRDRRLKLEVLAPATHDDRLTAIASLNVHEDHFSSVFDIRTADGAPAHTACVGFGLERMALALYRGHGLSRDRWPAAVRRELAL